MARKEAGKVSMVTSKDPERPTKEQGFPTASSTGTHTRHHLDWTLGGAGGGWALTENTPTFDQK